MNSNNGCAFAIVAAIWRVWLWLKGEDINE